MPKKKAKKETPRIQELVLIGKFSDEKCRQIPINKRMQEIILNLISTINGEVLVHEKVIEGIDIVKSKQAS